MDEGAQKAMVPCEHTEIVRGGVDLFSHTIWHVPRKEHPGEDALGVSLYCNLNYSLV
jgi:hypothetical protein